MPSEIFVNGNKTDKVDFYVYNLTLNENIIKIRFNKTITNCNVMFSGLINITNIIFNNFDFSNVLSMKGMFYKCHNLKSLDLSNLNTISVFDMSYMLSFCTNLISLNLSNFITTSVLT